MNTRSTDLAERIESKIDKEVAGELEVVGTGGALNIAPRNMGELMAFAKMMAISGPCIRAAFRNSPGACLGLSLQAFRWGMDPFAVSNKAYIVKNKAGEEQISYEAQLIQAVVNERAPMQGRLRSRYEGEGQNRKCIVSGLLAGEAEPHEYESPTIAEITTQNSPLWKSDPDQQLHYYATRAWARRWVPEVLLGVYTPDEIEAQERHYGPENAKDVSPRPTRASVAAAPEPVVYALVDGDGEIGREFESPAEYTRELIAAMEDSAANGGDFGAIWHANEDSIVALDNGAHREGCYEPLWDAYETLCKAEGEAGDAEDGEGEPEAEEASEEGGEAEGSDNGWQLPAISLEKSEAGVSNWKKCAADLIAAIEEAPDKAAVDLIMSPLNDKAGRPIGYGQWLDDMMKAGAKMSANQVKRAADQRRAELGPRETAEAAE